MTNEEFDEMAYSRAVVLAGADHGIEEKAWQKLHLKKMLEEKRIEEKEEEKREK